MVPALIIYIGGALVGLLASDAPPVTRVTLAILWPVGPAAFAVTVTILLAASLVAFPILGLSAAAAAAAGALVWALL